jgi:biopolymer transport protein ExbB/biopolymer transport protein TolQ
MQYTGFLLLQEVGFDVLTMWDQMGFLARAVVIILFIMSAWSIGVMIDRLIAFNAAKTQSRQFAPAVAGALREGKLDEAIKIADRYKKSHLAKVVVAGLQEFKAHQLSNEISGETIEASKRALERAEAIVGAELKRGVSSLATIGSVGPFVGLFGTVVGIVNAFKGIASEKAAGLGAVVGSTRYNRSWLVRGYPRSYDVQLLHQQSGELWHRNEQLELRTARLLHQAFAGCPPRIGPRVIEIRRILASLCSSPGWGFSASTRRGMGIRRT